MRSFKAFRDSLREVRLRRQVHDGLVRGGRDLTCDSKDIDM